MKPALKAFWFSIIDAWLAVKRLFWFEAGLEFETKPGLLVVEVRHRGNRKTVRIAIGKLDAAIRAIDRTPHGAAFVFREGEAWTLVPDFLVPDLRAYLVTARDALSRSERTEATEPDISGVVEIPKPNAPAPPRGRLN